MAETCRSSRPARLEEVRHLVALLQRCCGQADIPAEAQIDLELALVEAANNIVIHGFRGREDGIIDFTVRARPERVEIELEDRGETIPEKNLFPASSISLDAESGRGMSIIRACVDHVDYRHAAGVNRLILSKLIDRSAPTGA